jgi:hypothetical protein
MKVRTNPTKSKPWITTTILKSIKKKNKMYKKCLTNKSVHLLNSYKKYRNTLTSLIRAAEKSYYSNKLLEVKDNMSKTWKVLNRMTNRSTNKNPINLIEKNGVVIDNVSQIAEEFNKFFVNVGPNLANQIQPSENSPLDFIKGNYCNSMFLLPSTPEEISDIIINLKNSSSSGVDNIPIKLIKLCKSEFSSVLAHINNHSLQEGVFPDQLKIAKVVPIYKSGCKKSVSNYRPISVLSAFSKITEKIVYNRLERYLIENSILHKNQYGFRSKLSTSMALLELLDQLSYSIDNKNITVGVFIDLAKAFDTVDHAILLKKLYHYGIRGVALDWFKSYLSSRQQFVVIDGQQSDLATIKCGVPQGSVLGPILFLIYINDLNYVSNLLKTIMFADDTNLFLTGRSLIEIEKQLNDELVIITEWFKANLLSLNISKTSYIIFGYKKCSDLIINMHGTNITRQYETKFLGVILTDKLKFDKHIDFLLNKITKCIGIMTKIRHLIPINLTRTLYLTLVQPYIDCCNLVWCSPKTTKLIDRIFRVQKRYCRLMTFSSFSASSKPLFLQLHLLNVYETYNFQVATYMYKIKNNLIPLQDHHTHIFETGSSIHDYNTRHKDDLRKPKCRTAIRQNMLCFQGPRIWNLLPDFTKFSPSVLVFKKRIKNLLFSHLIM